MWLVKKKNPISKKRFELRFRGTSCLNCDHLIDKSDKYCPNCGQPNSTKRLDLQDFFDEFASGLINYDSKLIQTLYALLFRPGSITQAYINGKRMSYTNPFRFLLSVGFIYFLLVSYNPRFSELDNMGFDKKIDNWSSFEFGGSEEEEADTITTTIQPIKTKFVIEDKSKKAKNDTITQDLNRSLKSQLNKDSVNQIIENERWEGLLKDSLLENNPKEYVQQIQSDSTSGNLPLIRLYYQKIKQDSVQNFGQMIRNYGVDSTENNQKWFDRTKSIHKALTQPGKWLINAISKLPIVIFLLLPVFTLFVWVVYIRQKYSYTDHLIFSFHSQSLFFILLIISWIVDQIFGTISTGWALLIFGIYLFVCMKRFYRQGWFKTLVKYVFLNIVFLLLASTAVIGWFAQSAITY